jgi:hypothetical protein
MCRLVTLIVVCLAATPALPTDEAKGEPIASTTYPDYFEKNNSGLKGDRSFLVFSTPDSFNTVFTLRPPLMGGQKPVPVPEAAFEKQLVLAVITRGPAITRYNLEKVTREAQTIYVQYKAEMDRPGTATFASPFILSVDRGKATKVVFIQNGKTAATVEVK